MEKRKVEKLEVGMVVKTHLKPIIAKQRGRKGALEVEVLKVNDTHFVAQPKKYPYKLYIPFGGIVEVLHKKTFANTLELLEKKFNT
jgi:hypothetical protein